MIHLIAIALGGAVGALSRYGISLGMQRLAGPAFPWGTLAANVTGCLLLGMLAELVATSESLSPLQQRALSVGFLGALTTFSTFALETVHLLEQQRTLAALANIGLNLAVGLAAVWVGIVLVRQ